MEQCGAQWGRATLNSSLHLKRCSFLWPDHERTTRAGQDKCAPPPPLGTGNDAGRWWPREDWRPWGHQGARGCPFNPRHTVSCHLSRSDGDGTWNLCPGCSRAGCEIPQLSGENGSKVPIPWDTVEETLQVRTGMGCDLGAPCVFGSRDPFHPPLLLELCVG